MRIDLMNSKSRPWYMSLGLRFAKWRVGAVGRPPLTNFYHTEIFHRGLLWMIVMGKGGT